MIEHEGLKVNTFVCGNGRDFKPVAGNPTKAASSPSEIEPLMAAAGRGEVSLIMLTQDGTAPPPPPVPPCPLVVLIGDDPVGPSKGPSAFPKQIGDYIRGSAGIIVYSGIGAGALYGAAVQLAIKTGRTVILIQTQITHHNQWIAFTKKIDPQIPILEAHPDRGFGLKGNSGESRQQRRAASRQKKGR